MAGITPHSCNGCMDVFSSKLAAQCDKWGYDGYPFVESGDTPTSNVKKGCTLVQYVFLTCVSGTYPMRNGCVMRKKSHGYYQEVSGNSMCVHNFTA